MKKLGMDYIWYRLSGFSDDGTIKRGVLTETITGLIENKLGRPTDPPRETLTLEEVEALRASGTLEAYYKIMLPSQWFREVDSLFRLYCNGVLDDEIARAKIPPDFALAWAYFVVKYFAGPGRGVSQKLSSEGELEQLLFFKTEAYVQKHGATPDLVARQTWLQTWWRDALTPTNYASILQAYYYRAFRPTIFLKDLVLDFSQFNQTPKPNTLSWILSSQISLPSYVPKAIASAFILSRLVAPVEISPYIISLGIAASGLTLAAAGAGESATKPQVTKEVVLSPNPSLLTWTSVLIPTLTLMMSRFVAGGLVPANHPGNQAAQLLAQGMILARTLKDLAKAIDGLYIPGFGEIRLFPTDGSALGGLEQAEKRPFLTLAGTAAAADPADPALAAAAAAATPTAAATAGGALIGGDPALPDTVLLTEADAIRLSMLSLYLQKFPEIVNSVGITPAIVTIIQTAFSTIQSLTKRLLTQPGAPPPTFPALPLPAPDGALALGLKTGESIASYIVNSIEVTLAFELLRVAPASLTNPFYWASVGTLLAPSLNRYGSSPTTLVSLYGVSAFLAFQSDRGFQVAQVVVKQFVFFYPPLKNALSALGYRAAGFVSPFIQSALLPTAFGLGLWAWYQGWVELPFKVKLAAGFGALVVATGAIRQLSSGQGRAPPTHRQRKRPHAKGEHRRAAAPAPTTARKRRRHVAAETGPFSNL